MSDILDDIIAQQERDVNKKSEWMLNALEKTNWQLVDKDSPDPLKSNKHLRSNDPIAYLNKTYTSLEARAKENNLSDSFRTEEVTETRSATTRSLEKAIARYAKQYSILQTHN